MRELSSSDVNFEQPSNNLLRLVALIGLNESKLIVVNEEKPMNVLLRSVVLEGLNEFR